MIEKLFIKPVKGEPPQKRESIILIENKGVEGDCHANGGDRQVCIVTGETADAIDSFKDKFNCLAKFSPNVVLSGNRSFSAGKRIEIGGVILTVTSAGRECHRLCDIPFCPLISGIIFASVTKGGEIRIGDKVKYD